MTGIIIQLITSNLGQDRKINIKTPDRSRGSRDNNRKDQQGSNISQRLTKIIPNSKRNDWRASLKITGVIFSNGHNR